MSRQIDETHDPALRSWVESANRPGADFPIQNLPLGVFRRRSRAEPFRIGAAIGDRILDLRAARNRGLLAELSADAQEACAAEQLNALMALGPPAALAVRRQLVALLRKESTRAEDDALVAIDDAELCVPAGIGNYTDFYASMFHASNVGRLFRPDAPLLPNYKYVPIAYHGRASSVVVSATAVRRPWGQRKPAAESAPVFRPSEALDFELELGMLVGVGNTLGEPVRLDDAEGHLFGICLLNDWSARDIQAWEYQPLGPFLAKNFATTVSPWVVTLEALAPFRCPVLRPVDAPPPLDYLASPSREATGGVAVHLEAYLQSQQMRARGMAPTRLTRTTSRDMYWSMGQMVAHHTSNGCNLVSGDLLGTGTISGADPDARGCLLEITEQGRRPRSLPTGEERAYLADGDEVILRGWCEREGYTRIGFGECRGVILPALNSHP
jgi:fumarylacetoacetase